MRVAVDGVAGCGKTIFGDELAATLQAVGRTVIRISADDFHNPRSVRYRRGRNSPMGFWMDSYDYPRLRSYVLDPLSPGGIRRYRRAAHDLGSDTALDLPFDHAAPNAVLILDGLFLHRDELLDYWDYSIFLDVPFEVCAARMAARDGGSPASVARYVEGQRLYFAACTPSSRAHLVVDNSVLDRPHVVFGTR